MKTLVTAFLIVSSLNASAQALSQDGKLSIPANQVDLIATDSNGTVMPEELSDRSILLQGTKVENGQVVIDLNNRNTDVTSIIMRNGSTLDVVRSGGDMGGGRTVQLLQK